MTRLHSLTDEGIHEATIALARVRSGESLGIPPELLRDHPFVVPGTVELPAFAASQISNRWHLAVWLYRAFNSAERPVDPREWSWLALHFFDLICPLSGGARKVREDARYLLQADDYRKAHRHLLAGPYLLFTAHSDDPGAIKGLLATPPEAPGEVYEQLASKKYLITSRAVVATATALYLDPEMGSLRRGAGSSGPGSPRRLSDVLQQFDRTYDLQAMAPTTLTSILPREFARFLRAQ